MTGFIRAHFRSCSFAKNSMASFWCTVSNKHTKSTGSKELMACIVFVYVLRCVFCVSFLLCCFSWLLLLRLCMCMCMCMCVENAIINFSYLVFWHFDIKLKSQKNSRCFLFFGGTGNIGTCIEVEVKARHACESDGRVFGESVPRVRVVLLRRIREHHSVQQIECRQ